MVIISYEKSEEGILTEIGTCTASSLAAFLTEPKRTNVTIKSVTEISEANPFFSDLLNTVFVHKYTEWIYFVKATGESDDVPLIYNGLLSLNFPLVFKEDMRDVVNEVKRITEEDGSPMENITIDSLTFLYQK